MPQPQRPHRALATTIAKSLDLPEAAVSTDLAGIQESGVDLSLLSQRQVTEAVLLWKIADQRGQELLLGEGPRDAAWAAYFQRRRDEFKALAAAISLPV